MNTKTTEKDLRRIFEAYGEILDVKVAFNRQLNRSRGYGFVHYTTVEEATKVGYRLNKHKLNYSCNIKLFFTGQGLFRMLAG